MDKPSSLKTIGILQLISGIIQFPTWLFVFFCGSNGIACVGGALTALLGGCGVVCGFVAFISVLLVPIGLLEIVCGILTLGAKEPPRGLIKATAVLEIVGLFFGGLVGAIVGVLVWIRLQDDDIESFYSQT